MKRIFSLILAASMCFILADTGTTKADNQGLQTPMGVVSGKVNYTDSEIPDNPTLANMQALTNVVTVSYPADSAYYIADPLQDNLYNMAPNNMNLTGNIYHDNQDMPTIIKGLKRNRDQYIKILNMKLGDASTYEVIKTFTVVTFMNGEFASMNRNLTFSVYNKDYYNYIQNELNPAPAPEPTPVTKKTYKSNRIWGQKRMDTAYQIALNYNNNKVNNIILSSAYNFPDALSSSTLASKLSAPILLCGVNMSDSSQALDYINGHLTSGGGIYILGGTGVIGQALEDYLRGLGYSIHRLGGSTRFDTNKLIVSAENITSGTPVMIACSSNFPDALSGSGIAGIKGYPIVFSDINYLPQQSLDILQTIKPSTVYILGETGVISNKVKSIIESNLGLSDSNIVRMGGLTRYDTCLSIIKQFNLNTTNALVVSGENFPDALAGGILGVKFNAPIILVDNNDITKQKQYLDETNISNLYVLGGSGVITDNTVNILKK